jgi:outer membrane protein OmpA-like peptidoglycan-associated protein
MVTNLLEMLMNGGGKELTNIASGLIGESATTTQSGLAKLVPVVLGGMMQKASTTNGASDLFKMVTSPNVDAGIAGNLSNLLSGGVQNNSLISTGLGLASSLFGADKSNGLMSALASLTGMSSGASSNLVGMAMPLIFGGLKHVVNDKSLDSTGLANLLLGQKEHLQKAGLDTGLLNSVGVPSSAALLDKLPSTLGVTKTIAAAGATAAAATSTANPLMKWLPWIAAAIAALVLFNLFSGKKEAPTTPAPVASMTFSYPGKVYFATGSNELDDEAKATIANIVTAMNKDGNKVQITGYADKTGDNDANAVLAKNRAKSVAEALTAAGIKTDSIELKPPVFLDALAADDKEARRVDINRD